MPSQPKNNCIKLSLVNKTNIKKVKRERYPKNRIYEGSDSI
jgi:hypothetical protein